MKFVVSLEFAVLDEKNTVSFPVRYRLGDRSHFLPDLLTARKRHQDAVIDGISAGKNIILFATRFAICYNYRAVKISILAAKLVFSDTAVGGVY